MEAIMEKTKTQNVPVPMDDELREKLDAMVKAADSDRAKFIRTLVREKWDELEHLETLKKKVRNGGRQIKQLRAES